MMLASPIPMALLAGREGIMLYNDGYIAIAGGRHPDCFAASVLSAWPEVAEFNADIIGHVFSGESLSYEDQNFTFHRNGTAENVWLDLDYSPILDDDGSVVAVLALVVETTKRVVAEQELVQSREQLSLALGSSAVVGTWDWHVREDLVYSDEKFARLYGVDPQIAIHGTPIADFVRTIHPDDLQSVSTAMQSAMETGGRFSMEYRLVQDGGGIKWVLAEGQPLIDQNGQCTRFPGVSVDITAQKEAVEAHARSEIGFRTLADAMPQMVWSTLPDGFHDYYNARWYEFTGVPAGSTDGEGWNGMFHEEDQDRAWDAWRHSLQTGDAYQIEYRLRHHTGVYRWVLGRALPIRDEKGRITRWYGTCTDIHDTKMALAEREIVAHELSHRIKNIFSVLSGIISLSARSAPESRNFADLLRNRIEAMGRAHDFVRPHSRTSRPVDVETSIFGLSQRLLEPYGLEETDNRIVFAGDDTIIGDSSATPLALLLHELATNSAKYGALSHAAGRLTIAGHHDAENYVLEWKESGNPVCVRQPEQEGFGSRLMKISVEGQLGGQFQRQWDEDGVRVRVSVPVASILRSSKLAARS
ncbi:sensor histidine kinase [Pararhizobium sp.]|uniref:sensor histidine kinase n=1 Tax=Pararhizobium sp. TaxID=1977563 RepID=UPI003D129B23